MRKRLASDVFAYVLAVVVTAAAVLLRWLLDPWLGEYVPFITLFGAVAVAVWAGGYRPALVATALGFLACNYFFIEPRETILFQHTRDYIGLVLFLLTCGVVIGFGEGMRIAQRRAQEGRERLRTTFASIGDAVIATDNRSRITTMNPVAESLTGWKSAEAVGQPLDAVFRIVNEQTRKPVENPVQKVLKLGRIVGLANHTVLIAKDGMERPIDDSAAPIRCKEDEIVGCVLVFRDITERRRVEQQLADEKVRIESIVNHAIDGIVVIEENGTVEALNPAAERLFGYRAEEVLGRNVKMLMPEPFHSEHDGYLANYRRTGQAKIIGIGREVEGRRKDGSTFPMDLAVSEFWLGQRRYFTGLVRDITERKKAEGSLREQAALLDLAHDAIIVRSLEGVITFWNPGAEEMYGWTAGATLGKVTHNLLQTKFPKSLPEIDADLHQHGRWEGTLNHAKKDGTRIVVASRWAVRKGNRGETSIVLEINRDITEQKRAEEALQEADRRKNEFLAMLAHELRNPLAPIRNAVQILLVKGPTDPDLKWGREVIDRQVQHMARLLDDLLDVSRITHNKLELRKERVQLSDVIQSAIETSRPLIDSGGQELLVTLPPEPIYLDADPIRLAQVFSNLLNNAAKYSEPGGHIQLTCERQGSDVVVSVKDSGIGIAAEMLPRIFDIFSQSKRVLERSQGGLGIGLSLVRGLVELHGGRVEARSGGPGNGSEFVVRLPIVVEKVVQEATPRSGDGEQTGVAKRRLLIVDDLKDSADSLAMLLKMMGHEVHTAYNGEDAIVAAEKFKPELVLLDIGMPKLNGYDVCRHMRQQPWGKAICLIALTGWGQEDDRRRTEGAGFNHHMVKPVDPAALMKLLASLPAQHESQLTNG